MPERVRDPRKKLLLRVTLRGVTDKPFFFGQLPVEEQRVIPPEGRVDGFGTIGSVHRMRFAGRMTAIIAQAGPMQ